MENEDSKELQLLPSHLSLHSTSSPTPLIYKSTVADHKYMGGGGGPSLDLKLSINLTATTSEVVLVKKPETASSSIEALKRQAAEQIRLATIETAYAERVRELTRREMDLAQSEFARARLMWQRARGEVDRAERLKERAMRRRLDSTSCLEITCHSCRQKFKPQ